MRDAARDFYERVRQTVAALDLGDQLAQGGFSTFKTRDSGRVDMVCPGMTTGEGVWAPLATGGWRPAVDALLGPDAVLCHAGVILALPGAVAQRWHSDGDHVHEDLVLRFRAARI